MGLFDDIGEAINGLIDQVQESAENRRDARLARQKQRDRADMQKRDQKNEKTRLKNEAKMFNVQTRNQGRTLSGIATGDSGYANSAQFVASAGDLAGTVGAAVAGTEALSLLGAAVTGQTPQGTPAAPQNVISNQGAQASTAVLVVGALALAAVGMAFVRSRA